MQDDLCVPGIVLVPAIAQGLARPSGCNRREQQNFEARLDQLPGDGPMIVAGRLVKQQIAFLPFSASSVIRPTHVLRRFA